MMMSYRITGISGATSGVLYYIVEQVSTNKRSMYNYIVFCYWLSLFSAIDI